MLRRKPQRTPKTTTGKVFSTKLTSPSVFFAAALRDKTDEQRQIPARQVPIADSATMEPSGPAPFLQHNQQPRGQLVRATNVNSVSLGKMLKLVLTVIQQIMSEYNGALLE
jgi:hypothetical protein